MHEVVEYTDPEYSNSSLLAQHRRHRQQDTDPQRDPFQTLVLPATQPHHSCPQVPHTTKGGLAPREIADEPPRPVTIRDVVLQVHHKLVVLQPAKLLHLLVLLHQPPVVAHVLLAAPGVPSLYVRGVSEERQQVQVTRSQVRPADDPGHRFRVHGVGGEHQPGESWPHARLGPRENMPSDADHQHRREAVEQHVHQMVTPGLEATQEVVEAEREHAQGPVGAVRSAVT